VSTKNRGVAFFLNFFFPGMGFAYLGSPSLIVAGVVLFASTMFDSISDFQRAFDPMRLLLGLATALSLGVIAADYAETVNRVPSAYRKCPFCAEEVKAEAKVCKHCRHELGSVPDEAHQPKPAPSE
jgi:hypothetical protein